MAERGRRQALAALLVGVVVVVVGAVWVRAGASERAPRVAPLELRGEGARRAGGGGGGGGRVVVHVAGAVRRPGVYRLPAGTRIAAALRRAGGATPRADLDALNLAARVEDGRQVLVPRRAGAGAAASGAVPGTAGAAAAGGAGASGGAPGAAAPPVNLNTATPEQLDTLPGVGPATAAAILAYRQEHGGFGTVDELDQVPGIGPATLEALRDLVSV